MTLEQRTHGRRGTGLRRSGARLRASVLALLASAAACAYPRLEARRVPLPDGLVDHYLLPGAPGRRAPDLVIFLAGSAVGSALGERGVLGWRTVTLAHPLRAALPATFDLLVPEYRNVELGARGEDVPRGYTLDERVLAAVAAIDAFLDGTSYSSVAIVGHSEGALIAARVHGALRSRARVTRLALLSFGGLSQYESFRILRDTYRGPRAGYSRELARVDEIVEAVGREPSSVEKTWLGWPYRRWATFGPYRPIDDLRRVDVPVLIVHGDADDLAPVESSRFAVEELRRAGKADVTYREYPGRGHDLGLDEGDGKVLADVAQWLRGPPRYPDAAEGARGR